MTIVGDAVLRPLLVQLDQKTLRPLVVLRRGQRRRAAHPGRAGHGGRAHPQPRHLRLGRVLGDRGADARDVRWTTSRWARSCPARARWWSTRRSSRVLEPGHEGNGWLAQTGNVPLGYLGDPDKTARTFPVIDGVRYSIPGDRARHLADGQIELLGRDSVTVNSGGEKIFVEEVERAIAGHPAVADVVVAGRPSERWGQEVVAVVQLADGADDRRRVGRRARLGPHRPLQAAQGSGVRGRRSSARPRARPTTAGRPRRRSGGGGGLATPAGDRADRRDGAAGAATVHRRGPGPFFALNTHPLVVESLGSSPTRAESDAMVERYRRGAAPRGLGPLGGRGGRWAPSSPAWSACTGCKPALPFAPAVEVGWRLHPDHWGHGYATEAAPASLELRVRARRARRDRGLHHDASTPARRP